MLFYCQCDNQIHIRLVTRIQSRQSNVTDFIVLLNTTGVSIAVVTISQTCGATVDKGKGSNQNLKIQEYKEFTICHRNICYAINTFWNAYKKLQFLLSAVEYFCTINSQNTMKRASHMTSVQLRCWLVPFWGASGSFSSSPQPQQPIAENKDEIFL